MVFVLLPPSVIRSLLRVSTTKKKTITSIDDQSFASVSYHVQEKTDKDFFITQKRSFIAIFAKKERRDMKNFA